MKKILFCIISLNELLLASCSKSAKTQTPPVVTVPVDTNEDPDIYSVGSYNDYTDFGHAAYWKNDSLVILSHGLGSVAQGIAVSGNDVYVAGQSDAQPCYWKNGQFVSLSHGYSSETATGIRVNGADIYITGTGFNTNGYSVAEYWKNGELTVLSNDTDNAYAFDMAITPGNEVYVVGYEYSIAQPHAIAKCWRNGIAINLTDGNRYASADGIYISGDDIYVAGEETDISGNYFIAKYWKNGVPVILSDSISVNTATSIAVSGGDVYVAGGQHNGTISAPSGYATCKYWKNGISTNLSDGSSDCFVNSLSVWKSDIYSNFVKTPISGGQVAAYLKNGIPIVLSDGTKTSATVSRILLVPKKHAS